MNTIGCQRQRPACQRQCTRVSAITTRTHRPMLAPLMVLIALAALWLSASDLQWFRSDRYRWVHRLPRTIIVFGLQLLRMRMQPPKPAARGQVPCITVYHSLPGIKHSKQRVMAHVYAAFAENATVPPYLPSTFSLCCCVKQKDCVCYTLGVVSTPISFSQHVGTQIACQLTIACICTICRSACTHTTLTTADKRSAHSRGSDRRLHTGSTCRFRGCQRGSALHRAGGGLGASLVNFCALANTVLCTCHSCVACELSARNAICMRGARTLAAAVSSVTW